MNVKTTVLVLLLSVAVSASADIVRLPCRYVRTTWMENLNSGNTWDEKQKDTLKMVPVEVRKTFDAKVALLTFEKKAIHGETEDEGTNTGSVDYNVKQDLITALQGAKKKIEQAISSRKPAAEMSVVYEGDSFKAIVETGLKPSLTLSLGKDKPSMFILSPVNVQQLIDAIKKQ